MDGQLQLSVDLLDEAIEVSRTALEAWVAAVRDRADLGVLAALNEFGHQYLLSLRHTQYLKAEHWSFRFEQQSDASEISA